ncbi:hypothetical protein [Luteibacter yeojuensis]|uniref:Uncharacterized protein n=1 Tax=Luteibacter yeojuensis TaxID=345309 RepID=A0A7X5QUI9_9GAMM|nr:hypothetical protein [Luteibacter yeojuensis]NID15671.1 hypothetical protein [Luteibacter yeojuensis]
MSGTIDRTHIINPEASVHDLMNGTMEWLQRTQRLTRLLSELIDEADEVKCKEVAYALETLDVMTQKAFDCATHAHTRMVWEEAKPITSAAT